MQNPNQWQPPSCDAQFCQNGIFYACFGIFFIWQFCQNEIFFIFVAELLDNYGKINRKKVRNQRTE